MSNASDYADSLAEMWRGRADSETPFGFVNTWDDTTVDDIDDVPDFNHLEHYADNLPGHWAKATAHDWLRDVLDIEYLVTSRREYKAARIYVTIGGPNAYIDTASAL
jgi:hypothetical protein|uniref:Uncharacterized protein n=1 Tax=Acrobeloides nanus TaxID=290746 RepID=A0A914DH90_9BILA